MISGAAAALAVALTAAPQPQQWIIANRRSIAQIHDAKERKARERSFAGTIRQLAREHTAPVTHLAPNAGTVAREILANRRIYRFGGEQKTPPKTWWDRLTQWIGDRWSAIAAALFKHVRLSGNVSVAVGDLLLGLAICAFLFLIARLAWHYARPSAPRILHPALGVGLDAGQLLAGAERAAREGHYAQSVTTIFAAALCVLQARGLLGGDASQTIGELRRRVRRKEFDVLANVVTLALFADAELGAADWERARDAYLVLAGAADAHHAA